MFRTSDGRPKDFFFPLSILTYFMRQLGSNPLFGVKYYWDFRGVYQDLRENYGITQGVGEKSGKFLEFSGL